MTKKIKKMSLTMRAANRKVTMVRGKKNPSKRLQRSRNARRAEETRREELVKVRKKTMVHQEVVVEVEIVEERAEERKAEKLKSWSGKRNLVRKKPDRMRREKMPKKILIKSLKIKKILDLLELTEMTTKSKFKQTKWPRMCSISKSLSKMRKKRMTVKAKKRQRKLSLLKIPKLNLSSHSSSPLASIRK